MTEDTDGARSGRGRRWPWLLAVGVPVLIVIVVGLALFQPWQLFIDKTVDDTVPAGAAPIVAAEPAPTTTTTEAVTTTTSTPEDVPGTTLPPTMTPTPTTAPTTTVAPAPAPTMFVSLDHGTTGSLLLLQDADGRRFVRFENLATDQGPDVYVYLSTNTIDGPEEVFDDDYVNLGGLQGNLGDQNYEIPTDADLSRYRSVVIWCDRFDSAFGAAPLPA